jgi:hypothetical protein
VSTYALTKASPGLFIETGDSGKGGGQTLDVFVSYSLSYSFLNNTL